MDVVANLEMHYKECGKTIELLQQNADLFGAQSDTGKHLYESIARLRSVQNARLRMLEDARRSAMSPAQRNAEIYQNVVH